MNNSPDHNSFRILSLDDDFAEYEALFGQAAVTNVYALPSFLKAVQLAEKCPVTIPVCRRGDEFVMMPYIKRRINDLELFQDMEPLWDLVSPHEYVAVSSNVEDPCKRSELTKAMFGEMGTCCGSTGIVSEFVRFDPFVTDPPRDAAVHDTIKSCDNIYIDTRQGLQGCLRECHSSVRKNIRTAQAAGLSFVAADRGGRDVDAFIKLYRHSMQRLDADSYFFFTEEYFSALIGTCEGASLFFIRDGSGRTIAASILLHHGNTAHHHLTAYAPDCTGLRPNDFMVYSLMEWCADNHIDYLHLGGGSASICSFKGKFSSRRIPYYIGKRIHDPGAYERLCDVWQKAHPGSARPGYFPLYRARG